MATRDELDLELEKYETDYAGVVSSIEEALRGFADSNAAMAWSTPGDELEEEFGSDVVVVAQFGDAVATNGDPGEARIPKGYVPAKGGGRVPVTEEEVPVEVAIEAVSQDAKIPRALVQKVAEAEGMKELAYISVSGETEVWTKKR